MADIVLDANVLVAYLDRSDRHHEWALALLLERASDQFQIPALTLAEALVHPARAQQSSVVWTALTALELDVLPLRESDAIPLAELRAASRLRMPDAVVLHTTIEAAAELATCDHTLAREARSRGVRVSTPV